MATGEFTFEGTLRWTSIPFRGGGGGGGGGEEQILLVHSCYGNRDKFRPDGPLGSNADFTFVCDQKHMLLL